MIHRTLFVFWIVVAATSLSFGAWQALDPEHSEDLMVIHGWGQHLLDGRNPYTQPDANADYPPHGVVLLSLFALVPWMWLPPIWTMCKLAIAPFVAYLAVKAVRPSAGWQVAGLLIAMFLSTSAVRIGLWTGQVTMPLLGCGLACVMLSRRRPSAAGILLGLSLVKPHIGAPFLIWAVLTKQTRMVFCAAAVVLAGLLAFAFLVHAHPVDVVTSHWGVLTKLYGGVDQPAARGTLDMRPIAHAFIPSPRLADAAHVGLMSMLLMLVVWTAWSARRALGDGFDIALVGLLAVWSLAAFYNQPYNRVMILPGIMWLLLGNHTAPLSQKWLAVASLQIALVPSLSWRWVDRFTQRFLPPQDESRWQALLLDNSSRLVVLVVLAAFVLRINRLRQERIPAEVRETG